MTAKKDNPKGSNVKKMTSGTHEKKKNAGSKTNSDKKTINLALQGGGAHGAFAWGVLDRLLEDGRIDVEGISATSAGTMNACAYAYGKMEGGNDGARAKLEEFWWETHKAGAQFNPVRSLPFPIPGFGGGSWNMDGAPSWIGFDALTRTFSPYQLNPFGFNPLRGVVEHVINFDALRCCQAVKLFISATHVQTGRVRVFNTDQITADVAMASAALPFLFQAVNIDNEDYWDGGYMGNPALYPLFYRTESRDIAILHINPIDRPETPKTGPDIMNRINEITFNASLLKELRAIAFVKKLLAHDMLKDEYKDDFKNVLIHSIRADGALCDLSVASKFNSDWTFLTELRDKGRAVMETWLKDHFADIGVRDTVDLHDSFLSSPAQMFEEKIQSMKDKAKQAS